MTHGSRACLVLMGSASLLLMLPVGFIVLVIPGGGHGSPFPGRSVIEGSRSFS